MRFGSQVENIGLLAVRLSPDFLNMETVKKLQRNIKYGNGTACCFEEIVDANIRQAGAIMNDLQVERSYI